jgi:hypothetical protein
MIARGAIAVGSMLDGTTLLRAPLGGPSNEQWTRFVHALTICDGCNDARAGRPHAPHPRSFGACGPSGGLGCFGILPRRLADLGLMRAVRASNDDGRRRTRGEFCAPMTAVKFLAPLVQYNVLIESLRRYDRAAAASDMPAGMSRSGALALFHRLGPMAMAKWAEHKEPATIALFTRANKLF